jgi:hypothetical protein
VAIAQSIHEGLNGIEGYLDELDLPTQSKGEPNALGEMLIDVLASSKQLFLVDRLLDNGHRSMGQFEFRQLLGSMVEHDALHEYFAGALGVDALWRAAQGAERLSFVVRILPAAEPPEPSKRFLTSAVRCFLLGLDNECIVMCRGAIEVLVESLSPEDEGRILGATIAMLAERRRISVGQRDDMVEINRQAREVLHLELARKPPSAEECLTRLSRLLAQMHPAG